MSDILQSQVDPAPFAEPEGYWHYLSMVRCPDLSLLNPSDEMPAARLTERASALRVWWNNGPQHYGAVYSHCVTAVSAGTDVFHLRLNWKNEGGGVEKTETITDRVHCRDSRRHAVWSFSITAEQADFIKRFTAELFGPMIWTPCL